MAITPNIHENQKILFFSNGTANEMTVKTTRIMDITAAILF